MEIGYCTNVHSGCDLATTKANLLEHAIDVKKECSPDKPMGIGLWLSAEVANQLTADKEAGAFGQWLEQSGLIPFTMNGFPYGNFHQKVVKQSVYQPTWADQNRFEYTQQLIDIMHQLLPAGREGSISTLPVCWSQPKPTDEFMGFAAEQFRRIARYLAQLESEQGRLIYVCIEPEPGCLLQRTSDVIRFFEESLIRPDQSEEGIIRRHIRVCHDVCHSAVMFEKQSEVITNLTAAGIQIGKVQVSSAIKLPLQNRDLMTRRDAVAKLSKFAEARYLHQTVVLQQDGTAKFYEDLPLAIEQTDVTLESNLEMRVHFHVPIYLKELDLLQTTQSDIIDCYNATRTIETLTHYEIETYAWNVLPKELQQAKLANGIAAELKWFTDMLL